MSCFHPLKGFKVGYNISGKPDYKITSYDCKYVIFNGKDWIPCFDEIKSDMIYKRISESIDIPCGHCIGCYLDRSKQWADRCMLEASYHEKNCFITLTIDDEHLLTDKPIYHGNNLIWYPIDNNNYNYDGEVIDKVFYSLRKSDFQLFMKRFRKAIYPLKIRYFACSEYGSKSLRPHYHAIIFGYDFPDKKLFKRNFNNNDLYISEELARLWPFGIHTIAECSWNTAAYVSRYCLKKSDNDLSDFYKYMDCEKESVFMSRKPGIARQYYDDHKDNLYKYDSIILPNSNGKKIRPCSYFDKLYDSEYPDEFEKIKNERLEKLNISKQLILDSTDLDYIDYLKVKEYNLHSKTAILKERSVKL